MAILEEETFEQFGYYPRDLKSQSHKRIIVKCDDCGKRREISENQYCSLCSSCSRKGKRCYNWKGGNVKRTCHICGNCFEVTPADIKRGHGKYCSRECSGLAHRNKVKRIYQVCGKTFETFPSRIKIGNGKYCSKKCKDFAHRSKVKRICKVCGKEFEARRSQIRCGNGEYCSLSCASKVKIKKQRYRAKPQKTRSELIFEEMCTKYNLPFHFVGDGTLYLGNANPDFIHNTRKLCVEVFGDYWHSPLLNRAIRYTSTLKGRRKQLKAEGYKLIVIWESDLKRSDAETFVLYTLAKYKIYPSTI